MKTISVVFFLHILFITQVWAQRNLEERIVFCSSQITKNGDSSRYTQQIYTMDAEGKNLRRITSDNTSKFWPKWYAQGQKIIFNVNNHDEGVFQIMSVDADGKNLKNISTSHYNDLDPAVSPDNENIVFANFKDGICRLMMMNVDGSGRKIILDSLKHCLHPDWSPDGQKLVYIDKDDDGDLQIFRVKADGSNRKQLTQKPVAPQSISWSKHGYYILFTSYYGRQLCRIKPDGTELAQLTKSLIPTSSVRWSGHYKQIAFSLGKDSSNIYKAVLTEQFEMDTMIQLTSSDMMDYMLDWYVPAESFPGTIKVKPALPANYRIAFTSYRSGSADVYTMDVNGTNIRQITDTDDANSFARDASDGESIIYRKAPSESGYEEAFYTVNLTSGEEKRYAPTPLKEGAQEETFNNDSSYIAYGKKVNGCRELFLYDVTKGVHQQITSHQKDSIKASFYRTWWSPNGKELAYLSGPDYYNLYLNVYNVETGNTEVVTPRGFMFSGVVWLSDNKSFILNTAIRNEISYELWRINRDGTGLKQLTNNPGRGNLHPQLSPDGNWVAYESGRDGDDGEIYLMRPDGSQQTRITYHRSYEGRPAWIELK